MTLNTEDWLSAEGILDRFDGDRDEALNYQEFRQVCIELFGMSEVNENEQRIQEIFNIFDADLDTVLNESEWKRCHEKWILPIAFPVNVLLVVDVQNDFIDGSLALRNCGCGQDGAEVIAPINQLVELGQWDKVIYSLDWHPKDHISFYENLHMRKLHPDSKVQKEKAKPFDTVVFSQPYVEQTLWPSHCVMNTWGAKLHKDLTILNSSEQVRKGQNPDADSYSVFADNNSDGSKELESILSKISATNLYVCGLAYDVCVKATCLDGLKAGYQIAVIDDCCRGIDTEEIENTKKLILKEGGLITDSKHVLSLVNEGKRSLVMAHFAATTLAAHKLFMGP